MRIENSTPYKVFALPCYGPGGKPVLTVIVKGTFEMPPEGLAQTAKEQMPVLFADELYQKEGGSVKFESDLAAFKPRADVILIGKAHTPGGRMVQVLDASLKVGSLRKILRVFGDREWDCSSRLVPDTFTAPQPFREMDLIYERAYGGMDGGEWCRENPVGRGFIAQSSKKVADKTPLPNVEDPAQLIRSWKDRPRPAGFGFYGRVWMPRAGFLGTYDGKWRETRSPAPPDDFRFDFCNAAHPELQVPGYLRGDEDVELVNLSPEGALRFRLPSVTPAVAIARFDSETREAPAMNLDTLCLIPGEKKFFQIWRGVSPVHDLSGTEVKTVEVR
ncbi:MAG TPA: DUF2169 domain-containing protein [Thermodesulfobacteriota bacterium]|nr:DUF2169 domain-containing protein [Thermodesulfobacteriota bacterium]